MTTDEITLYAANNELPKENLNMAEWVLFYGLRDLYRGYRGGVLTRDFAAKAKTRLLLEFRDNEKELREAARIYQHHAKMWRDIERAAAEYAKSRTVDKADAFFEAVYGVGLKKSGMGDT